MIERRRRDGPIEAVSEALVARKLELADFVESEEREALRSVRASCTKASAFEKVFASKTNRP